jgi:hypothetical protein
LVQSLYCLGVAFFGYVYGCFLAKPITLKFSPGWLLFV